MSLQDELREKYQIDILADEAGGYVSPPSEEGLAYTDLFFSACVSSSVFGILRQHKKNGTLSRR